MCIRDRKYILWCGQDFEKGGFFDKPGKSVDYYHTNYALSGLSISMEADQNNPGEVIGYLDLKDFKLKRVDPVYNICEKRLAAAQKYFNSLPKFVPTQIRIFKSSYYCFFPCMNTCLPTLPLTQTYSK
eukprot:TRINITY_DN6597_c0_g1_i2.p2 TRINITY_DN6597_c0_g1~~TRINITY_DN6597_c0_g1_i2.p2  ORF type:complete len:148 (-),score=30.08 TRINITY_DN6597_c0_g1_i2:159-542(-)